MIKVLFISSGNIGGGKPTNLILAQGESLNNDEVNVEYFTIIGKGISGYLKNVRILKEKLKGNNYDILHAHYGFSGIIAWLAKTNQKVIVSLMGSDLLEKGGRSFKERALNRLVVFLTKFFSKYFLDYSIVKSSKLAEVLFKGTRFSVIPNGVNTKVFFPIDKLEARMKLGLETKKRVVLFSTDPLRPEKNFQLAKSACDHLKNDNVELMVVHGVSQEELNLYYNASDVVLMTSLYEGSPNVIKEAMACNRPIVSTEVGDVRENLQNVSGAFTARFTEEDVTNKLKQALLCNNSNGREKMDWLDSKIIAQKIINVYKEVLK